MQFTKNTSSSRNKGLLIKVLLIFVVVVVVAIMFLGKIEVPYPNKDVEKIISNEKLKIVK